MCKTAHYDRWRASEYAKTNSNQWQNNNHTELDSAHDQNYFSSRHDSQYMNTCLIWPFTEILIAQKDHTIKSWDTRRAWRTRITGEPSKTNWSLITRRSRLTNTSIWSWLAYWSYYSNVSSGSNGTSASCGTSNTSQSGSTGIAFQTWSTSKTLRPTRSTIATFTSKSSGTGGTWLSLLTNLTSCTFTPIMLTVNLLLLYTSIIYWHNWHT